MRVIFLRFLTLIFLCYVFVCNTASNTASASTTLPWNEVGVTDPAKIKKRADSGEKEAQYLMGLAHAKVGSKERARFWYKKAAKQGLDLAKFDLGVLAEQDGNQKEAEKWYLDAAKRGHKESQVNLGLLYLRQNKIEKGEKWLKKGAKKGSVKAQFNLGILYAMQKKFKKAQIWLEEALKNGDPRAKEALDRLVNAKNSKSFPLCPTKKMFGHPMKFVTNIYGYMVEFDWKDSKDAFCIADRSLRKDMFSITQIPQGTTLDNAKEQFAVAAYPKILVPNKDFLNGMTKQRQSSCKKTSTKIIKNKKTALEFVTISTSCANSIRRIDHYLMKRRGENTYIFSYLNEVLDGKKYTTNSDIFKKWSNLLNSIEINAIKDKKPNFFQ